MAASERSRSSSDQKAFLLCLPANVRGTLGNLFHHAVRTGSDTPVAIIRRVASDAAAAACAPYGSEERRANLLTLLSALDRDPEGARDYAAWCIWWNNLDETSRQAMKQTQAEESRKAWMGQQPPTPAQLRFLEGLGCTEQPANRWQASDLIDSLQKAKAAR